MAAMLSVFLVLGMTGMHGENVDAATETMGGSAEF